MALYEYESYPLDVTYVAVFCLLLKLTRCLSILSLCFTSHFRAHVRHIVGISRSLVLPSWAPIASPRPAMEYLHAALEAARNTPPLFLLAICAATLIGMSLVV